MTAEQERAAVVAFLKKHETTGLPSYVRKAIERGQHHGGEG